MKKYGQPMNNSKQLSKEQVLVKLTSLCAKSEYCTEDMRNKMKRWEIDAHIQDEVIDYLIEERYIDDARFTRAFVKSKIQYNKWGINKIKEALYLKHISQDVYEPILNEIENDNYKETLLNLLSHKIKSVKANTEYEKKGKLIRFALQRGFTMEQAMSCIEKLTHI